MAKLMTLAFIFSIQTLLQCSYCKHEKHLTYFTTLGVNVDLSLDSIKNYLYSAPVDKELMVFDKENYHMITRAEFLFVAKDIAIMAKNSPGLTILSETLQRLLALLNIIDDAFRQYESLEGLKKSATDDLVYQFAKNSTNRHSGPLADVLEIYSVAVSPGSQKGSKNDYSRNMLSLLTTEMKSYQRICDKHISQQLMFQPILDSIILAEFRVFLITEFAIRKLAELHEMDYKSEVDKLKNDLQDRFKELTTNFHKYMTRASREVWRCGPNIYIIDETYFKMNFSQLFVTRDLELADYYDSQIVDKFHVYQDEFSDSNKVWTYPSNKKSTHINEVLEEENPDDLDEASTIIYAGPKINLRPATADQDHVITGIRWIIEDNTLHLQIQQGKILPRGKFNMWTVDWKAIKKPRDEHDLFNSSVEGLQGFLLKDIVLPKDRVLVGVKLEIVKSKNIKLLTVRLLGATYEYKTGKLNYTLPFYDDPDNSVAQGLWNSSIKLSGRISHSEVADLGKAKLPTSTNQPSMAVDITKTYVLLTTSNVQTVVGQNIVLFFDMVANIVSLPIPLSGIGIYLKKDDDCASFLALKLLTFDHTHYIA